MSAPVTVDVMTGPDGWVEHTNVHTLPNGEHVTLRWLAAPDAPPLALSPYMLDGIARYVHRHPMRSRRRRVAFRALAMWWRFRVLVMRVRRRLALAALDPAERGRYTDRRPL